MRPVLPGATIGVLGGGQLGRMTALAARAMGYRVHALDPDPECACSGVVDELVTAPFDDEAAAARLARECDVVTYEIERVGLAAARAVTRHAPLRPSPSVLATIQDRAAQKCWLARRGYPLGPWAAVEDGAAAAEAARRLGPVRLKRARGGYDGRGQQRAMTPDEAARAFAEIGAACVVEQELQLSLELSVLVARSPSGAIAVYPPARNWHERGVLVRSVLPAPLDPRLAADTARMAHALAYDLQLEGLLAVELFVDADGRLLVNELSARPHNTFHHAVAACVTGQFEQLVRAMCDLPLGSTEVNATAALANLTGDLWKQRAPPLDAALAVPGVALHLYGKAPHPGRKVGHLVATSFDAETALALVARGYAALTCD